MQYAVSESVIMSLYARIQIWIEQRGRRREALRMFRLMARAERRLR